MTSNELKTSWKKVKVNKTEHRRVSFLTSYGTLKVSPYFKQIVDYDCEDIDFLENDEIFIDRDGDLFNNSLEYLKCYEICTDNLVELQKEAKIYQLKGMVE